MTSLVAPTWPAGPARVELAPDEVHVWSADLERSPDEVGRLATLLTDEERQRAERLRSGCVRREFTVARAVLRLTLARYLRCDPRRLRFRSGPQGKPELADGAGNRPLHFNVSHSHGLALYAFTACAPVGVDVERLRPFANDLGMAERYFSSWEFRTLAELEAAHRTTAFFHTWTRKEAFLKATGGGIAFGLERVEVSVHPEEARVLRLDGDEHHAARWSLQTLRPAPDYVGALALETQRYHLRCWHFHSDPV